MVENPVLPFAKIARLLLALSPTACAAAPSTLHVGAGQTYATPSAAIAEAGDGDTILIASGQYFDCAVVSQNHLTIAGVGDAASVVLTDKTCQGKALLVTTGANITVRNLTLTRARVPDGNGAGIRVEGPDLTVDGVDFVNNQDGILTTDSPSSTLIVRNSRFDLNGVCGDACAHAIYAGHLALVRVENSVFLRTREGHAIKSRALRTEVTGCDFEDGPTGTGSYMVEAPNGGSLVVRDNTMEKGPRAGNHTVIAIGTEGVTQPTDEITIAGNKLTNDGDYRAIFVNNITATEAALSGNHFTGSVLTLQGDGSSQ